MRVALYLRVSTKGPKSGRGEQTTDNQRRQLEESCAHRGWTVSKVYEDRESGAKGEDTRAQFRQMLADSSDRSKREFDVVMVWSLDRFSREGIAKVIGYMEYLASVGVRFASLKEPFLDTTGEFRQLLLAIFSWVASFERNRTRDRIVAALDRKKAEGVKLGRPEVVLDREECYRMVKIQGLRKTARYFDVSPGTVSKRVREWEEVLKKKEEGNG